MIFIKEYAIYPFRNMNISQNWNEGNHVPHWKNSKNYSDKPWDEAGRDSGKEYFIPQNDFLIEEVLGLGNNVTNSVRLKSVNKVYFPYQNAPDYLYLTLTHMNEDNLKQVKKGQILKKGSQILLEGTDGNSSGNHFHVTASIGKYYGLLKNSNGAWCYTYEKSLKPEEAFYIDSTFNNVINSKGSVFKTVPTEFEIIGIPVLRDESKNQIEVKVSNLRCRLNPGLNSEIIGYIKEGIYDYKDTVYKDDYLWYNIGFGFIAYSEKWFTVLSKRQENNSNDNVNDSKKQSIFQRVFNMIKKIFK